MIRHRLFVRGALVCGVVNCLFLYSAHGSDSNLQLSSKLARLEATANGRLGVAAIDTANNNTILYRATERFPLCSTSKVMVVGAILAKSRQDPSYLNKQINYSQSDKGMTISQLCHAAIAYSDNTAMNLLLQEIGGPAGATNFARSLGDNAFNLVRYEPMLNSAVPGDIRDTSTPLAMSMSLHKLVLGNSLGDAQRQKLQQWLIQNTTGNDKIRAGLPKDWVVADKTGAGAYGSSNDIAIVWPGKCQPLLIAIYFTQPRLNAKINPHIIADATRILINEFKQENKCLRARK